MHKTVGFLSLLMLTISSTLFLPLCSAIPTPSVPEFTLNYIDESYDVSPTYSTDPYTGKSVLTQAGYRVENKSVEVVIKNQQFSYYYNENGSFVGLYYNIRYKGYFETYWHQVKADTILYLPHYLPSSYAEYTFDYFGVGDNYYLNVTSGGQVDFQVKAFIGYYQKVSDGMTPLGEDYHYEFVGESSGWSSTKTITIGDGAVVTAQPTPYQTVLPTTNLATESPTATPQQPTIQDDVLFGLGLWQIATIMLGVVVVLLVFVVFYLRRRSVDGSVK